MVRVKEKSKFGKLSKVDFWKGLIVAAFSAATTTVGTAAAMIMDFTTFEWMSLLKAFGVGLIIGLSGYLPKNLFSNSDGKPFKKEH